MSKKYPETTIDIYDEEFNEVSVLMSDEIVVGKIKYFEYTETLYDNNINKLPMEWKKKIKEHIPDVQFGDKFEIVIRRIDSDSQ